MHPGSFRGRARDAFVVFRRGVGVTDCEDSVSTGVAMNQGLGWGSVGRGAPQGGPTSVRGFPQRAGQSPAPTEDMVVRWDGGRPQGSPLRRARWCGGTAGDRKGRPYGGECIPLKCIAEFAARRRQTYAHDRLGAFWQKNRRFFVRDDKRAVPDRDSPFESVKRVYCAALAALMDSISSGTTLNRSPTIP